MQVNTGDVNYKTVNKTANGGYINVMLTFTFEQSEQKTECQKNKDTFINIMTSILFWTAVHFTLSISPYYYIYIYKCILYA